MDKQELAQEIKRLNALYRAGTLKCPTLSMMPYLKNGVSLSQRQTGSLQQNQLQSEMGEKKKLPIPMKSLNKVKSLAEVKQWLSSLAIPETAKLVITPKYDGVSWLHNENSGKTYSRGGAENEGQDCTTHFNKGKFFSDLGSAGIQYSYGELVF